MNNTYKIRCLAVDDEPLALKQLANYIERTPTLELAATAQSAAEALDIIRRDTIDALFLDINMPDMNGFELLATLSEPPLIVFTTAYAEYAIDGFKANALDYLLKPFGYDDFKRAADKVVAQYNLLHTAVVSTEDDDDTLFLRTEHRIVRISIADILFVEGMSEYLKIHFDTQRPIVVLMSMKRMEERLLPHHFMRIHRSYIINLRKIKEVNKSRVILSERDFIPIGDLYREQFVDYLNSKFLQK